MVEKVVLLLLLVLGGCTGDSSEERQMAAAEPASVMVQEGQKATFVELGSVNCIPCRQMQPVMKAVGEHYGEQLKVVFYDIWNPKQSRYAEKYGIRVIPTQVFLDSTGKEFFRHEGFLSEEQIDVLLKRHGLVPLAGKQR